MTGRPLRVAILAHSTNPRGGVVHALELGDALVRLGHQVVVHAPDAGGAGFFRRTLCETVAVRASPLIAQDEGEVTASADTHAMVTTRITDYLRHFEDPAHRRFDVFHAQDGISANALATLKQRGLIARFARTVHHMDAFADGRLDALQRRSIVEADAHFVVSALWADRLKIAFSLDATQVGNGVDLRRFTKQPQAEDLILRHSLGLQSGPVFLAIGGIEARKNTVRTLEAFAQVHHVRPAAQLVIAGGRSLLDHSAYQAEFATTLAASGLPAHALRVTGLVADTDMPALYRNADALVFPSISEGFGLVVLEAMATGLPVVASRIPPFTEYLEESDALWCAPDTVTSIADAMMLALYPALRKALAIRGPLIAARHDWRDTARAHLAAYERLGALQHA